MTKYFLIISIAVIVILIAAGLFFFWQSKNPPVEETKTGIEVTLPQAGQEVSSPLEIKGTVSGGGWIGFEGQVGTVKLFNSQKEELALGILQATTDWMQPLISFESTLNFTSLYRDEGELIFYNENPSGIEENNKQFVVPVKITKTVEGIIQVKLYFNNNSVDDTSYSCNKVLPVDRGVLETKAVARAALEELLKGPTRQEILDGYFTSINDGVKIQKLTIDNSTATAYVDFDDTLEKGVGGSCRVAAIREQIRQTLLQFITIKNVVISINGRTEDILQP